MFFLTLFLITISHNIVNDDILPVVLSILLNRFDICLHLISLGANINYKMIDRTSRSHVILDCLYKHKKIN